MGYQYFHGFFMINKHKKRYLFNVYTFCKSLYVLLTWGPHMVYKRTPYIFYIYMIRCGWLGCIFDTDCNRHCNETMTLWKHISKYKSIRKWMAEFLRTFENHCIKIVRVNSILIAININLQVFTLILYGVWVRCDRMRFSVHSPYIQKSTIDIMHFKS